MKKGKIQNRQIFPYGRVTGSLLYLDNASRPSMVLKVEGRDERIMSVILTQIEETVRRLIG